VGIREREWKRVERSGMEWEGVIYPQKEQSHKRDDLEAHHLAMVTPYELD